MTFRKAWVSTFALVYALTNAVPAVAQRAIVSVVAPPAASLSGLGVAGAAPSLSSPLPQLPAAQPLQALLPTPAAASIPAESSPEQVQASPTVQEGLNDLSTSLQEASLSSPGSTAPLLDKAFDSAPQRSGEVSGVAALAGEASQPVRPLSSLRQLRLGTYNVLNLFAKVGKHVPDPDHPGKLKQVSERTPKEEQQRREQAKAILESGLDIVVLQEVENIAVLQDFAREYLGGAYKALLIEGNDERGIDVAFLVKKDLPFQVEQRSHKDEQWTDPTTGKAGKLFSRDLPSLIVRSEARAEPLFVLFGGHFKSKRDRIGDPESKIMRRAQMERTAEILARYKTEFGENVPLMLAADFNGDLNSDDVFAPLWNAGLANSLDLGALPASAAERVTHTFHPREGQSHASQMDGILVSKSLSRLVQRAEVYRYKNPDGTLRPVPATYAERALNPSDHFPLLMTLDFLPLLRAPPQAPRLGLLPEPATTRPAGERTLGILGLAWSFLTLTSMSIVMPVRSAFLLAKFGPEVMPWVYMASAVFTGLAAWLYARATSLPRARLLAGTLAVLAAGLVAWWALAPLTIASGPLSFAFSMWTDAFTIMSVTIFWTYANDRFKGDAAKRWFGPFAAASALGGMAGSALTSLLVKSLGAPTLLLIATGVFAAIGGLFFLMERRPDPAAASAAEAPIPAPAKKPLSDPWSVARAILASPFLLAMTAVVFLERLVPDFSNYLFNVMTQQAYPTREAMAAFMAAFSFWQNLAALVTGALMTQWVLKKLGVGKTLLGAPLVNFIGFIAFALSPTLGVSVAANGADGWQRYGWFKAAKETAYTAADKDVLYQVKAYVEMFVYRFARGAAGLLLLLLAGRSFLGLGAVPVAWAAVPLAALWVWAAWKLGAEYKKLLKKP